MIISCTFNRAESVLSFIKAPSCYGEGVYSVVFFSCDGKATKIFRKRPDAPRKHVEKVFNSEVRAYQIAQNDKNLRSLIPKFFGCVVVQQIKDRQGNDISSEFHLDLAYEMERIEGHFVKLGNLPSEMTKAVYQLFRLAGICHMCDASVTERCGNIEKVIDFAIEEHVLEHQLI